jgi:hypothetical protein
VKGIERASKKEARKIKAQHLHGEAAPSDGHITFKGGGARIPRQAVILGEKCSAEFRS